MREQGIFKTLEGVCDVPHVSISVPSTNTGRGIGVVFVARRERLLGKGDSSLKSEGREEKPDDLPLRATVQQKATTVLMSFHRRKRWKVHANSRVLPARKIPRRLCLP